MKTGSSPDAISFHLPELSSCILLITVPFPAVFSSNLANPPSPAGQVISNKSLFTDAFTDPFLLKRLKSTDDCASTMVEVDAKKVKSKRMIRRSEERRV